MNRRENTNMVTEQMMHDLINCAKTLPNDDINKIITELNLVKENRANELRRAAADKVIQAISAYLDLGEEISICGGVYNEEWGGDDEINATFDGYSNHDGYLTFNFIQ